MDSEEGEGSLSRRKTGPSCPASLTQAEGLAEEELLRPHADETEKQHFEEAEEVVEWTSCAVEQEETSGEEEAEHIAVQQTGVSALVDTSGIRGQTAQTAGRSCSKKKREMAVDLQQLI